jgi:ABC-type bacteriocin/lantibiotic exporter with double-glycine peptidase domain
MPSGGFPRCAALLAVVASCAGVLPACYTGSARQVSPAAIAADPDWQLVRDVPFVAQQRADDCGAAALAMVLAYWQVPEDLHDIARAAPPVDGGIRAGALRDLARSKGLQAFLVSGTFADVVDQIGRGRPLLVGLAKPMTGGRAAAHYEVLVGVNRPRRRVLALDPARGLREDSAEGFAREWVPTRQMALIVFPGGAAAAPP